MIIFSYNLTPGLSQTLKHIDKLRAELLLTPLSIKSTNYFAWQATLSHLTGWSKLANQPINHDIITKLVSHSSISTSSSFTQKAIGYLSALDHLWLEWIASANQVTPADIKKLTLLLDVTYAHESEITSLLSYVQTGTVHPVIQAAIVHLYFYPSRLAYIASLLFIYKGGFDLKRMLAMEEFWQADKLNYLATLQNASKLGQITLWLEYYCEAVETQMTTLLKSLTQLPASLPTNYFKLSDRQKQILSQLQIPGSQVTNRQIQALFKVTQVTASRDLAKLASLNLILSHAAGRSTSYSLQVS